MSSVRRRLAIDEWCDGLEEPGWLGGRLSYTVLSDRLGRSPAVTTGLSASQPSDPPTSSRIGRYEIVGRLETGGMAEILLARLVGPSGFERPVVIKRILPHLSGQRSFEEMFLDEARILVQIRHPNVVQVHELGRDDSGLFLVMEYLDGESLLGVMRRLLNRSEPPQHALSAFVMAEACAGLHAAHESKDEDGLPRGLVHRDVSPQNIFLTYSGQVKLLDFGIAKAANRSTQTEAGQVKGKFAYMSPEQCLGKPLDRRSDVFALGIVLWELATGRRLFLRANELLTFRAICKEAVPPISRVVSGYPPELERICMKALAYQREERYATAQEMRHDLLSAARQLGLSELAESELAELMDQLFAARIEEKREMLRRVRSGSAVVRLPEAEADPHTELPSVVQQLGTIDTSSGVARTNRGESRKGIWLVLVGLLLAVGTVALLLVMRARSTVPPVVRSDSDPTLALPAAPSQVAPAKVVGSGLAAPQREEVTIRVETQPPGARVTIGKKSFGKTPAEIRVPRDTAPLKLLLERRGYRQRSEDVVPNVSQRLVLPLTRVRRPRPKPSPTPRKEMPVFPPKN